MYLRSFPSSIESVTFYTTRETITILIHVIRAKKFSVQYRIFNETNAGITYVSKINCVKGEEGNRSYHRINKENKLPHRRAGIANINRH